MELPYVHKDLFEKYGLAAPKGVLLYGPPGCGKTLIAKAVANSLALAVAERTGRSDARSYFLNIKGPELLNKYVGETERQIRLIFQRAKEKSEEGVPVIVFFDEMDSLFRTRGSGISSDVESTIVPQLPLRARRGREAEERHRDRGVKPRGPHRPRDPPARSARREDQDLPPRRQGGTPDIPHLPPGRVPLEAPSWNGTMGTAPLVDELVSRTVDAMYATDEVNRFLEVTYANGDREVLFKDFSSGAMIENIVRRRRRTPSSVTSRRERAVSG